MSLPGSPAEGVATLCSPKKKIESHKMVYSHNCDNTPTVIGSALREKGKFDLTDPNLV